MNHSNEVLKKKGIKQTLLAEKLGQNYNMVNSYIQNRRQPSLEILSQVALILNVDVRELILPTKHD